MEVHRIHGAAYGIFDTMGSALYSGRWHTRGSRLIYAAQHISLAALEVLVHAGGRKFPPKVLTSIQLPDDIAIEAARPMKLAESQNFGDLWLEQARSAILRVPSVAVNNLEYNYLLNPAHPDFKRISHKREEILAFDVRLLFSDAQAL
jgi:RES domain-containing protein